MVDKVLVWYYQVWDNLSVYIQAIQCTLPPYLIKAKKVQFVLLNGHSFTNNPSPRDNEQMEQPTTNTIHPSSCWHTPENNLSPTMDLTPLQMHHKDITEGLELNLGDVPYTANLLCTSSPTQHRLAVLFLAHSTPVFPSSWRSMQTAPSWDCSRPHFLPMPNNPFPFFLKTSDDDIPLGRSMLLFGVFRILCW